MNAVPAVLDSRACHTRGRSPTARPRRVPPLGRVEGPAAPPPLRGDPRRDRASRLARRPRRAERAEPARAAHAPPRGERADGVGDPDADRPAALRRPRRPRLATPVRARLRRPEAGGARLRPPRLARVPRGAEAPRSAARRDGARGRVHAVPVSQAVPERTALPMIPPGPRSARGPHGRARGRLPPLHVQGLGVQSGRNRGGGGAGIPPLLPPTRRYARGLRGLSRDDTRPRARPRRP